MKKLVTISVLMALAIGAFAQQFNFSAVCESGQTLYYRITNAEAHTVILTHPYPQEGNPWFQGDYYEGYVKPQGEIIIPSVVTYNGADYTVTAIDSNSFWMCIITSVFIPNTVNYITPRAFGACEFLESISMEEGNPTYYSESNTIIRREDNALVVGCKTSTIPDGIEIICQRAFYVMGYSGVLTIPNSVRIIEDAAFAYNSFSGSLTLPESLETLGLFAFYLSGFSGSLTMPNSVTEIGNHAFYGCGFTGSLTLSSSLSTIENCAFANCHFSGALVIPNSVNLIVAAAFAGNDFSELVLGNSVATIESNAFLDCNNLTGALRLPTSLTQIDQLAFKNTSFNEIHSPNRMPPTLTSTNLYHFAFDGYDTSTPIHIPFGCTEAYQNAEGWDYFNNYIEEEPIIYRDFEPDSILIYWHKLGPVWIDLDADGEADDFRMQMNAGGQICYPVLLTANPNIRVCIVEPDNTDIILSEVEEENWKTCIGWIAGFGSLAIHYSHYGFRIQREEGYYYGWFETYDREVSGKNEKRIVHHGFDRTAYCTIPNYPLRWGQIYLDSIGMEGSEWYYEILNDEGSFTYQHLECTGDTVMQGKRPKIIVRSNTHYNRDTITEVTHEYVYEENGKVYWWNQDLQEFTTLYDLTANTGDEWEIKVGTESLNMHVDAVETTEYEGVPYRVIHVSDPEDLFSGEIVVGFGHMTSFFPENLMNRNANFTVNGLRCYWIGDELIYHNGEEDCDAIYTELHGVEENDGDSFVVYPNPTNGVLTVSMRLPQCDSPTTGQTKYRIINLMGQTILQGCISSENQQIDIANLPAGMYFICVGGETVKFVVR